MNLVKVNLYAEGGYSGAEYSEDIYLLEEDYKKIEEIIKNAEIYICDLDGKHSEVEGDITTEVLDEKNQLAYNFKSETRIDGDELLAYLEYKVPDINQMIRKAVNYINTLDSLVEVKFEVKKSQVDAINQAVLKVIGK